MLGRRDDCQLPLPRLLEGRGEASGHGPVMELLPAAAATMTSGIEVVAYSIVVASPGTLGREGS